MRADSEGRPERNRPGPTTGNQADGDQGQRSHQAVRKGAWDAAGQPVPSEQPRKVVKVDRDARHDRRGQERRRRSSRAHEREQREEKQQAGREVCRLVDNRKLGRGSGARDDAPKQVEAKDESDEAGGQGADTLGRRYLGHVQIIGFDGMRLQSWCETQPA